MNEIWKYTIKPGNGITELEVPRYATLLSIESQGGFSIELWFQFDTRFKDAVEIRTFEVIGTGIEFEDANRSYRGTTLTHERDFVWHVFERHEPLTK